MELDKFKDKGEEEEKEEEKMEEKRELRWDREEDRTIIATALNMLGFKQTKRDDLFVKQISKEDAIFVDFSKNPKGVFYPNKGSKIKVEDRVEYKAFRAMQKGQARINPEKPNEVIVVDDEGKEQVIVIPDYVVGEEVVKVSPQDFFIEWEGKRYYIKQEFIEVIKGRYAPNIKGIIDVVQRANAIKDWKTEILREPEKILPKQVDDPKDPDHYEEPEDIYSKDYLCIAKATVVRADGKTFTAHGSAHPLSVSGGLRPKVIEMAETRSLARALKEEIIEFKKKLDEDEELQKKIRELGEYYQKKYGTLPPEILDILFGNAMNKIDRLKQELTKEIWRAIVENEGVKIAISEGFEDELDELYDVIKEIINNKFAELKRG